MKPSAALRDFLSANPLPWIRYDAEREKLVMVVDNHLMSTYRQCPQHFIYANVFGYRQRSEKFDGVARSWFLDFGILLHRMLELYYRDFRKADFDVVQWSSRRTLEEWNEMQMDVHAEHKEFKVIGGVYGLAGLLMQYAQVFAAESERFRIIGQEISFGRAGEVPLYESEDFDVFLAGRMDDIIDDGYFICPLDHKSKGFFKPGTGAEYETDEGPTGYIFALSKILPQIVPEDQILKRDCSKIVMNLISKKACDDPRDRFKRIVIRKTTEQLAAYQGRMIATAFQLLNDMERVAVKLPVQRNTEACQNWHYYPCPYYDVDRQSSFEAEKTTLNNGYIRLPIWNTEEVKPVT